MSVHKDNVPTDYWDKSDRAFIFCASASAVLIVSGGICLFISFLNGNNHGAIWLLGSLLLVGGFLFVIIGLILLLEAHLNKWQYQKNIKRELENNYSQTVEGDTPNSSVMMPSPLRGKACDYEQQIVEELRYRTTLRHPRANVAQLLRALIDRKLLDFNIRQKDDLMRWVIQETGFDETSVSAFNEAVNNATGAKVAEANAWINNLLYEKD